MADSPSTRPSLLVRIRNAQDRQAWAEFVDLYAPLVYGFARKHGLQDADAADLTQEVLRAVSQAAAHLDYDPRRGSFRGWLFTIVRNKLRSFLAGRKRQAKTLEDTDIHNVLKDQPAPEEDASALWDREYEQRLFAWAAAQVRDACQEATWQAFAKTAVEGKDAREVARELGMTVAAVYLAKSRVLARLKEIIRQSQGE
jgi:RNA polymerase sigma-70 factor (ECF subfamily)